MTKIGQAKQGLSEAIKEEFGAFGAQLEALGQTASILTAESVGINGVSTFWRGIGQQLQTIQKAVNEKETEVLATLAGKPKHEIKASVDPDLAQRAAAKSAEVRAKEVSHG